MEGTTVLLGYSTVLKNRNRKCPACGKLVRVGEACKAVKSLTRKYYPVKGLMGFTHWRFYHPACPTPEVGVVV